jgi:hypothetical protein
MMKYLYKRGYETRNDTNGPCFGLKGQRPFDEQRDVTPDPTSYIIWVSERGFRISSKKRLSALTNPETS